MSSVVTDASSRPRSGRMLRLLSDDRLVARVRAGDERAFEAVYDRYQAPLLSFCRHMLGDRDDAEDAVQHTCISAYRALLADDRPIQLKAWLFAIARNRCLTMLRARREHADVDDHVPATAGLATEVEQREDLRTLLSDLHSLPDDQRAALVLMEIGAHSHDEIAVILDVRKEKVKALVFQAREQLQARRTAREADCTEIREQLATLKGPSLRRASLRHHLAVCPGCEEFAAEVRRQRAALGALLPVVPGAGLKTSVLGSLFGGGGAAGGGGAIASGLGSGGDGAAAAAAGLGALGAGGGLFAAIGAQSATVKALATIVAAGGLGGAGYVAVDSGAGSARTSSASSAQAPPAASARAVPSRPVQALGPSGVAYAPASASVAPAALGRVALTRPSSSLAVAFAPFESAPAVEARDGGPGEERGEKKAEKAEKKAEKAQRRGKGRRGEGRKGREGSGRGERGRGRGGDGGGRGGAPSSPGPAAVTASAGAGPGPSAAPVPRRGGSGRPSSGGRRGGGAAKKSAPAGKGGGAHPRSAPAVASAGGKGSGRRGGKGGGNGKVKGGDSAAPGGSPADGGKGGGNGKGGGRG